ncbi:hypothetical protein AAVH_16612, partial [Aphelenchoides avenae]
MAGDLHLGKWRTVLKYVEVSAGFFIVFVFLDQWYGKKALNHYMDWRLVTATVINLAVLSFNGARLFERACKYCGLSHETGASFAVVYVLSTFVSIGFLIWYSREEQLVSPIRFWLAVDDRPGHGMDHIRLPRRSNTDHGNCLRGHSHRIPRHRDGSGLGNRAAVRLSQNAVCSNM